MWVKPAGLCDQKNRCSCAYFANTETAKIPGISAAGKSPELTDYTPAADAGTGGDGKCHKHQRARDDSPSGRSIPRRPDKGINAADRGSHAFLINSGLRVRPQIPDHRS